MSAEIIHLPKKAPLDNDRKIAEAIRDFSDVFIRALAKADEGLALIHTDGCRPCTKHMVERFAEHLDELQEWAERLTLTRNLARYHADLLAKDDRQ